MNNKTKRLIKAENKTTDKVFVCPKCKNKTLYPMEEYEREIGYHDLCICDECGAELYSVPQYDMTVRFIEIE